MFLIKYLKDTIFRFFMTKNGTNKLEKRIYKFYPEDFGKLKVKVLHMDLDFDVFPEHTVVDSVFKAVALEDLSDLNLNAKGLEILSVSCDKSSVEFEYFEKEDRLHIKFKSVIKNGTEFVLKNKNIVRPTKHILEGLYFDETPPGAPPTMITQCQQWGFQRIVPCIDDMTAKCTYKTSITADKRYTDMISNGDIVKDRFDVGKGREKIIYSNEITPMATYLFILCVGTYKSREREFEYPDGSKFILKVLAPLNALDETMDKSLEILFNGIMWIHLFTGPDRYKNYEKSQKIMSLIDEREKLKKQKNYEDVEIKRKEIHDLISGLNFGYKYTGTIYREIGMQNSDIGGMENVGNTTITANRLLPWPEMTDRAFEYLCRVKTHEFYHNLNGSEVTGWSPFEIWLNEAVTVHVERWYHEYLFGANYSRLGEVQYLMMPSGVFMEDEGAQSMPIEPEGFNTPNELITHITYVKAPEFVKMLETLMGEETFVKGLHTYHTKYKHSNATREQWLECMEKASGLNFKEMAEQWLKKTNFPLVEIQKDYNKENKKLVLSLKQKNATDTSFWEFPFIVAVFDENGKKVAEKIERVNSKNHNIVFNYIKSVGFVSFNRNYSFYGKAFMDESFDELVLKLRKDDDLISRYLAWYNILDKEKTRLIENPNEVVDEKIVDLYFELISNDELMMDAGAQFMTVFEFVEKKEHSHKYQELYDVKKKILRAIASKYKNDLIKIYNKYNEVKDYDSYLEKKVNNIKRRQIKNVCLGVLSALDTPDIHKMIKNQYENAVKTSDKMLAFDLYINSEAEDKLKVLDEYEAVCKNNLVLWEMFLYSVSRNNSEDAIEIMKRIENSDYFRIEQTNDQRGLYMGFAYNKKKSLLTIEGRAFLRDSILKLATINEYTALHLLEVFGNLDLVDEKYHVDLVQIMVDILEKVDEEKFPSVYKTTKRMLLNLPIAKNNYEKSKGKIKAL